MRRWIAGALAVLALALGAAACGSDDSGGVIEAPATTSGSPGTTSAYDYGR